MALPTRLIIARLLVVLVSACQGQPPATGTVPALASTQVPATPHPTTSVTHGPPMAPSLAPAPSPTPIAGLFRPEVVLALKQVPTAAITGKFDGNGTLDIAAMSDNGYVTVLLGSKGGAFTEATIDTGGDGPGGLASSDINGDHRPDIVIVHVGKTDQGVGSDDLAVLLGKGDGSFKVSLVPTGVNAQAVVIADLDRDGRPDLATANHGDHVSVFRGQGDGTFRAPVSYPIGSWFASGIAAADFDGDGTLDLVTANSLIGRARSDRTVSILLGTKSGTFASPRVHQVGGPQPILPFVADLNGDRNPDVVTPDGYPTRDVSVLLGDATGALSTSIEYETGPNAHTAIAADLDGDGNIDIAAWNNGVQGGPVGQGLAILFGVGDGTFKAHVDQATVEVGGGLGAAADLDDDGRIDLIVNSDAGLILLYNTMAP
jgi:hypothetical protein